MSNKKIDVFYEYDFTISQVESHLIFGPISRRLPFWYLLIVFYGWFFITELHSHADIFAGTPVELYEKLNGLFVGSIGVWFAIYFLRKQTLRQQAIFGWGISKITFGMTAFMFLVMGPINILREQADGIYFLLLGIIWFPSLEFIPKVAPNQKYITIARIILSIPCVYFLYKIQISS